ncbi:MAG: type II secretion system minor pseudopilin GspK, partial [Alloalcanivorax venustensis]
MGVLIAHPRSGGRRRQQGMALIIVLMLFAILAAVTTEVMFRQDRFRVRTENLLEWDKRYQYAMAAEVVAVQGLIDDLDEDRRTNQQLDECVEEQWAVQLTPTPYEDAILSASVQDLQGRFNLNWLVEANGAGFTRDDEARDMLQRLLQQTLPDPGKASILANEMTDWIDSNNIVDAVEGAEDAEYRLSRTPNMPVAHESEMRALRSFEVEDLFPDPTAWGLFTALPSDTALNVNTAPLPVLDAVLGPLAGSDAAEAVVSLRQEEPIEDIGTLMQQEPFSSLDADQKQALSDRLGVASEYFQVMVDVEVAGNLSRLVSRVRRSAG